MARVVRQPTGANLQRAPADLRPADTKSDRVRLMRHPPRLPTRPPNSKVCLVVGGGGGAEGWVHVSEHWYYWSGLPSPR
jgi:hypothetical protein